MNVLDTEGIVPTGMMTIAGVILICGVCTFYAKRLCPRWTRALDRGTTQFVGSFLVTLSLLCLFAVGLFRLLF